MTVNLHVQQGSVYAWLIHSLIHLHFSHGETHGGVKQRGVRRARAAEEAVLRHQVLVSIYRVLHVLAADQAAEQSVVRGRRQVHAVIALSERRTRCDQSEQSVSQFQSSRPGEATPPE